MSDRLDAMIKETNKKMKCEIITKGLSSYDYRRIPFTSPRMNYCTFGGIPMGRVVEFYGEEGGGKTTSALDIVSNYQAMEDARDVLYVDVENTLDVEWAKKLDVDIDKLYILQPETQSAEEIFDTMLELIQSGDVGLWVIDSLAAMVSEQEWEKDSNEMTYGGISKPLTRFSKKVEMLNHKYNCTGIGINQEREDLKSTWGGLKTPGGKAWKYLCSSRLNFSRGKFLDEKGNELTRSAEAPSGNIVLMKLEKTKTCPPNRRIGQYTINYEYGIDYLRDLIDVAIKYDIVQKSGAWFDIVDIDTGEALCSKLQGQAKVYEYLDENVDTLEKVENLVNKFMGILN